MIVRFSVSNFLSFDFNDNVVPCIDMTATKPRNKIDHILEGKELLKSTVMFGGNGSGKSNIIKGLKFLKKIVTTNWMPTPSDGYYCKNTPENKTKPIRFKIEFIKDHDSRDLSDIMDWYINRSRGVPIIVDGIFKDDSVRYEYEIELQYVSDDIPYNISQESCYIISYGRRTKQFCYENDMKTRELELARDETDFYSISKIISHMKENISEIRCKRKILELDLKDIESKIAYAEYNLAAMKEGELDIDVSSPASSKLDAIVNQRKDLLNESIRLRKEIDTLTKDESYFQSEIIDKEQDLENFRNKKRKQAIRGLVKTVPVVRRGIDNNGAEYNNPSEWIESCYRYDIYDWFANTLVLVDIRDKVLPIRGFEELDRINAVLPYFDAHIKGLTSIEVNNDQELKDMVDNLDRPELRSFFGYAKWNSGTGLPYTKVVSDGINFYELRFRNSKLSIRKLMTEHEDGSIHELFEESDGTRRLIELATVLVEPKINKVYVIDELDRRLHPLITKNFITIFYKLNSQRMQLIITTHETRIATTNIFRQDEICLVDHDDSGTRVTRAKDALKTYNKPFEDLYLDDLLLGGVPRIKNPQ